VRTRSLVCLQCYGTLGRASACAGLRACESARWPRAGGGETEEDRRVSGRGSDATARRWGRADRSPSALPPLGASGKG
jgi:hypothetical protein